MSAKGSSVVDYCILPHDDFHRYSDFTVTSTLDLINAVPELCQVASAGLPDHSLLTWKITISELESPGYTHDFCDSAEFYDKLNLKEIPETFLHTNETRAYLNETIDKLGRGLRDQQDIGKIYSSWCDFIKTNICIR